ncbi:hypothetical protein T484DRAFT_1766442 [Baffinella frigidus]|nr:hypothetical protein T484DRAFT_1766442 [Cryptophyta sp. CCMP2293]
MGKRKLDGEGGEGQAGGHGEAGGKKRGEKGGKGGKAGGKPFPAPKPQKKEDDGGEAAEKYKRGERNLISVVTDKKLKMDIKRSEKSARGAAAAAARAEILLPSDAGYLEGEGMEKTQRFQQHKIKAEVDGASAQKIFTLRLDDLGPYRHT